MGNAPPAEGGAAASAEATPPPPVDETEVSKTTPGPRRRGPKPASPPSPKWSLSSLGKDVIKINRLSKRGSTEVSSPPAAASATASPPAPPVVVIPDPGGTWDERVNQIDSLFLVLRKGVELVKEKEALSLADKPLRTKVDNELGQLNAFMAFLEKVLEADTGPMFAKMPKHSKLDRLRDDRDELEIRLMEVVGIKSARLQLLEKQRLAAGEESDTAGLNNNELLGMQQEIMTKQDEGLDVLSTDLVRVANVANAISTELDEQLVMLDSLDKHVDQTAANLRKAQWDLDKLNGDNPGKKPGKESKSSMPSMPKTPSVPLGVKLLAKTAL